MNPIKVLFVMRDALPPFRPDARVMFGIELAKRGVASDLVGPRSADREGVHSHLTWPAGQLSYTGPAGGMAAEALKTVRDLSAIRRLGNTHDLVLVRDRTFSALASWAVARWRRKPFVFWMSFPMADGYAGRAASVGRSKGWITWIANNLRAWLARRVYYGFIAHQAQHIFVQSDAMLAFMHHTHGIAREKMTPVPMGVDVERLNPASVTPSIDARLEGRRVVIYLGDLGLARQPGFLFDVAHAVRQRHPDVLFILAGEAGAADEKQWLRERVAAMKLESHVWITSWLPQTEALQLVRRAEIGLSPIPRGPLYDVSSPTKALEYLAMGVPCVGNDIPDQQYVLQASQAGVCVPMDVQAFTEAIDHLLKHPDQARAMGQRGPDFVQRERSYSVLADRVHAVLRRLTA